MNDGNFTEKAFQLLQDLEENNNKEWYTAHKREFESHLRHPFAHLLEQVTDHLSERDIALSGSAKTMFRQNRDIRFSKDKSPYSTHVSGVLTPSGAKDEKQGLLYLHLDATGGMSACGLYKPPTSTLNLIRDEIIEEPEAFSDVINRLERWELSLSRDEKLKSMPRGYSEHSDHEHAEYLKLKSFITQIALPRRAWLADDLVEQVVSFAEHSQPLLEFCGIVQ
ncbi:MAG: TIGR02453 family protein [Cyanobacteria bacterium J06627_8]